MKHCIHTSQKVFAGVLLNVYRQRHQFPSGYTGDLEVIKHPGAALIVPFLDKHRIILIRQFRPVIGSYLWELPAGTLQALESPLACARRELIEETGYRANTFKKVGIIFPAPGYTTEKIHVFKAAGLRPVCAKQEEDEMIRVEACSLARVKQLFHAKRITDAKTICALALTKVVGS